MDRLDEVRAVAGRAGKAAVATRSIAPIAAHWEMANANSVAASKSKSITPALDRSSLVVASSARGNEDDGHKNGQQKNNNRSDDNEQ